MNKEEIRFFKLYISRTQENIERKDIFLFDYIRKTKENYNEDFIVDKLYNTKNKNAFYRLKNRLMNDIHTGVYLQHFDKDLETLIFHLISLSKIYFNRNESQLALNVLKKAERKAEINKKYELLDIIYNHYINFSLELPNITVDEYLKKKKYNAEKLDKIRQINEVLAAVSYKLKTYSRSNSERHPILHILNKTIDDISDDKQLKRSVNFRFKVYETASKILLQNRNYIDLEVYLLTTYLQFDEEDLFDEKTHHIKLQMLSAFIETLYNNKKYDRALSYVYKLGNAMKEYNALLYNEYLFVYHNSLVKNLTITDQVRAIEKLEQMKTDEECLKIADIEIYIFLSLAIIWFEKKDYHKAIANIYKLYMYNSYTKTNTKLKYKIAITELIIRFELADYKYIELRIKQMQEEFATFLLEEENKLERNFIEIFQTISKHTNKNIFSSQIYKEIHSSSNNLFPKFNEIKFINYAKWLEKQII